MTKSTARILAEWKGHTVHVRDLSPLPGRVLVTTTDGTSPFSKYYAGSNDPFRPDDCQPEIEPEYDEYQEWQQMTSELRRGEG